MANNLKRRMEQFLQQENDFIWLTSPYNTRNGRHNHNEPAKMEFSSSSSRKHNDRESKRANNEKQITTENNRCPSHRGNFDVAEQHSFEERVVYTTFPSDLSQHDFEEYVDRKFSNLNLSIREEIKNLAKIQKDKDMGQTIHLTEETDGSKAITLVQMLLEKNPDSNEFRISVGYIKFMAKSKQYSDQIENDWQINQDRVVKALQYKYGLNLKRELE